LTSDVPRPGARAIRCAVLLVAGAALIAGASCGSGPAPDGAGGFDLPLVVLPPEGPSPVLALVLSGDGNWAHFVRQMADTLSARGLPVVGLESRSYLSHPRTPDELERDLEPVLRHYLETWKARSIVVVGFSRGADFAPFLVNRLPADLRARVLGVALFSPTRMASFVFHLSDLMGYTPRPTDVSAVPEVDALAPLPVLCVYGTGDEHALCPRLPPGLAEVVATESGHRLSEPGRWADLVLARFDAVGEGARASR